MDWEPRSPRRVWSAVAARCRHSECLPSPTTSCSLSPPCAVAEHKRSCCCCPIPLSLSLLGHVIIYTRGISRLYISLSLSGSRYSNLWAPSLCRFFFLINSFFYFNPFILSLSLVCVWIVVYPLAMAFQVAVRLARACSLSCAFFVFWFFWGYIW